MILIPTFALVYFTRVGDFYQSNATSVSAPLSDDVRQVVEDDVRAWYRTQTGSDSVHLDNGSTFAIDDMWIREVTRSQATEQLNLSFSALACAADSTSCDVQDFQAAVPVDANPVHVDGGTWFVRPMTFVADNAQLGNVAAAFPAPDPLTGAAPAIAVRPEAEDQLASYWQAAQGSLPRTTHSFERMLYLSAITITTVGYGDVVPRTFIARVLVASEAVLGIVIAGLFLNAIAHHSSRGEPG